MNVLLPLLLLTLLPLGGPQVLESSLGGESDPGGQASAQREFLVQSDPRGSLVAVTLQFPGGAGLDPQGREGTTHLLGRWLEAEAGRRVADLEAGVTVEVTGDDVLITLLAPPTSWQVALDRVEGLLSASSSAAGDLERLREEHRARLVFESGAPVRLFELGRSRLLAGPEADEVRPVRGTPESLARITADDLASHLEAHLQLSNALTVVVGPVNPELVHERTGVQPRVISAVAPFTERSAATSEEPGTPRTAEPADADTAGLSTIPTALRTRLFRTPGPAPDPSMLTGARAWDSRDRIAVDMELTAAWMAVAWAFPDDASSLLLEFLAHNLLEILVPSPPDPGLYGADVQVVSVGGQPVVMASVTADPRAAARWEERVAAAMELVAQTPPQGSFFELTRRRFRNEALLAMSDPAERSRRLARDHGRTGELADFGRIIWQLSPEALAQVAASAAPPRIFVLGPLEMIQRGPGR
ncbi:MAG: insulinase family protein [Gemmatimonadales bacterium]|nr:MAG: insulinase family protein [Gemmatimonadales bacterium]